MQKKANRFFYLVFSFFLSACTFSPRIIGYESNFILIDSTLAPDNAMTTTIAPYKKQLSEIMDEVIAFSEQAMFRDNPEGTLGNFTADIALQKAREFCKDSCTVDLCVLNNGSLRNPIPEGNITRRHIFELMPFENEIIVLKLNGAEVKELFDFIANKGGMPVSGMRMKIKNNMATDVVIGGIPFDISKSYRVVTSDYLANGGDNMTFFSKAIFKVSTGKKLRNAIIEYLKEQTQKGNTIKAKKDGRIQIVE